MGRIVVIGSYNTDHILETDRLPRPGETVLGATLHKAFGGKGANQAVAAARMGAEVVFVGKVGCDADGDRALEFFSNEGIDVSNVKRDRRLPTGVAIVIVGESGQNAIVVAPGANSALSPGDVDKIKLRISDVMVLQLEIPLKTVVRAIENAAKAGTTVILNPAPAAKVPAKTLKLVDWIIPNETETAMLTGLNENKIGRGKEAAKAICKKGACNSIVTLGAKGIFFKSGKIEKPMDAYKVKAVDTTAAGDAFVGVFAAGIAKGENPVEAAQWAQAAAAISVTKLGATPSLPKWRKVASFLKERSKEV